MPRPRNRNYDELRQELVDAGGRLLAQEGPSALSTRRVAQLVGVSTTAVYSLFGDKSGLVRAMFLAGFERLAEAFAAVPRTDDPVADLLALGHAYRESALANTHLYELMFGRPVPEFTPDEAAAGEVRGTFNVLDEMIRRCLDADRFAPADPNGIAVHMQAIAHGLASLELRGALGSTQEARRHWETTLETTMRGLRG